MSHITPWNERAEVLAITENCGWNDDSQGVVDKAKQNEIDELRAALAQPAEPTTKESLTVAEQSAGANSLMDLVESYAKRSADTAYLRKAGTQNEYSDSMYERDKTRAALKFRIIDLIGSAQPAEPVELSDKDISAMANAYHYTHYDHPGFYYIKFARAILAAAKRGDV